MPRPPHPGPAHIGAVVRVVWRGGAPGEGMAAALRRLLRHAGRPRATAHAALVGDGVHGCVPGILGVLHAPPTAEGPLGVVIPAAGTPLFDIVTADDCTLHGALPYTWHEVGGVEGQACAMLEWCEPLHACGAVREAVQGDGGGEWNLMPRVDEVLAARGDIRRRLPLPDTPAAHVSLDGTLHTRAACRDSGVTWAQLLCTRAATPAAALAAVRALSKENMPHDAAWRHVTAP